MKELKKVISLVLCFVLIAGIMPANALATEAEETVAPAAVEVSAEPTQSPTEAPAEAPEEANTEASTEPSNEATEPSTVPSEPPVIAVTGITLDQTALEVGVGAESVTLTAAVAPENAADKTVTWTSSEPGVVSVVDGVLTFGYIGKAVITATAGEFSATCAVTVSEGEASVYANSVVVIAGSDFQLSNSDTIMTNIMTQIDKEYGAAYGVLMGGDYDASSVNTTAQHIVDVDAVISDVFYEIDADNRVYLQGNHENYAGLKPDGTNLMTTEHVRDTDYYGVYAINHDDFPWTTSTNPAPSESLVQGTADALGDYLDAKIAERYAKPIFVMSHLPLHATTRGDNRYAKLIFDELEAAGEAGLNIIFLVGHNHSGGYDAYLGNGSFYLPVGSSLTVVDGKSNTYTDDSISFTYMNYGYLGKITGSACNHQTMTAFEITEDQVTVKRFAEDGLHQLKAAGAAVSGYNTDTNVIGTEGAIIELGEPEEKVTVETADKTVSVSSPNLTGLSVAKTQSTADGKHDAEVYSAYASYDIKPEGYEQGKSATVTITLDEADGFDPSRKVIVIDVEGNKETETSIVDGKVTFTTNHFSTYSIAQRAVGNGYKYELVTSIEAGEKYVIVGNDHAVALMDNNGSFGSQDVTIDGTTLTSEVALTEWTISGTDNGTIISDANNQLGYDNSAWGLVTEGTVEFDITAKNGSFKVQMQRGYNNYNFYYDGTGWTDKSTSDQYVRLYKLAGSGSVTPEGGDWVTVTEPYPGTVTYTYTQATSITAGEEYVIVGYEDDVALLADGTTMNAQAVSITGTAGSQTMTSTTALTQWTFSGRTSGYVYNGTNYLYSSSNGYTFRIDDSQDTLYFVDNENNFQIKGSNNNGYSFYYDGSKWATSSSNTRAYVRLYQLTKTEAGDDATVGLFARIEGKLEYDIERGLSDEQVLALVQAEIKGYEYSGTSVPGADVVGNDITGQLKFVLDKEYNGAIAGSYSVTIYYKDKILGTAKVNVPEVAVTGIEVNPASGTVTVGASEAALVGATITVKYEDGTTAEVPVTVGILKGTFDTKTAGTYEGLTVEYGNHTADFTLTVKERVVNNYPSYPDEGAVKVDKSATGIDFQKTGVARVELSTSGVPMNQGVDVVLILDTSSSMGFQGSLDSGTRIGVLQDCVDALIVALKADRADGSASDIDIAIADFAGYLLGHDGTKLDNYIVDQVKSTDPEDVGGVLTGGWVDVHDLADNWGTENIKQKSGTNYDHGMELAYNLLAQKQIDDPGRKQFVLFMSDGAPLQYNGVNSNDLTTGAWENWILGSYTQEQVNAMSRAEDTENGTLNNPEFYYGNNNDNGQKHWVAEAIKGAPSDEYSIVCHKNYTYDSATMGTKVVNGLGATMYSVGLALEAENMPTDVAGQEAILKTIASSEDVFYSVTSAAGLQDAFDDFAGAIMYAAENAVFEDQLGSSFNIQLANTTTRKVDGVAFTLDPAPTMEVREYTIWTRAELEDANGNLSEDNAKKVGTRKTDESGNYIYNTIEIIKFNADGTEAYIGDDTTNNIMVDGVICAKTFWFNNSGATVKVDKDGDGTAEFDLEPETFLWNVGTIGTKEITLSYYVYLDDSLEGEASAGSYETNNYAILEYDNYLGNPCHKDTTSPQMAWLSANVSYAYYLVNEDGDPVDENGTVVTFANRKVIVNPTKYEGEIKLNSLETLDNLEIASTGVLDDSNYTLFDYDAKYKITVMSDNEGQWDITVGTKTLGDGTVVSLPATTYVTGFSDTVAFTNEIHSATSDKTGYDYTHTTVWFAVVWEPEAKDDTVVIDYGLPVDVHVMTNDFFGDFGTLVGVAAGEVTNTDNNVTTNEIPASDDPAVGTFGTAEVMKPESGANESNSVIRYTLSKENGMQMTEPEVFTYSVEYTNTKLHTNNGFYYGTLTVIPATTIYYEDDFLTLTSFSNGENGWEEDQDTKWNQTASTGTQDEDRPGDINFAFDTVIDANNVYGNDSAYETMAEHSLGNAARITVDANSYGTAEFTFWGTGFDVISLTSNKTGTLVVQVYKESVEGERVRNTLVDTYYGMEENGALFANTPDTIYQVPVIKIENLDYGKYYVQIVATYGEFFDHNSEGGYDLYLDAIRIYDPAGTSYGEDGNINSTIQDTYIADGEAWPVYEELRNNIISASNVGVTKNEDGTLSVTVNGSDSGALSGAIFIDCNDATTSIADYISYGPNNELYLAENQAIAFNVNVPDNVADIQLGIKVANGGSVTYEINGDSYTVNTATDMYYSILDYATGTDPVVIKNVEGGILSLTNIKVTHTSAPATESGISLLSMDGESAGVALMMLRRAPVIEEEIPETTVPEETEPETTVPETTVPEETEPETTVPETEFTEPETEPAKPDNSDLKATVDAAKQLKEKDYTKESYQALKAARKAAEKVLKDKKATQAEIDEALEELNEAVEALETKAPAANKPGKNDKENQNKPNSNKNNTTIEQQVEQIIVQIANTLFGWLFN